MIEFKRKLVTKNQQKPTYWTTLFLTFCLVLSRATCPCLKVCQICAEKLFNSYIFSVLLYFSLFKKGVFVSGSLSAIRTNYIQNFPTELPMKAAQGFIATTVISLITGCAPSVALLGGTIAATATIIEAITRPIIRAIFPETPFIATSIQIFIPQMMALGLADSIAPWIGTSYKTTSILLPLLAWISLNGISLNGISNGFYGRNVAMVEVL
jgi:hypothetical protein